MATKTVPLTDEACMALLREKKGEESFTGTTLRIPARPGKLATCFDGSGLLRFRLHQTAFRNHIVFRRIN
jgi:hypothetical protein